MRLIWTCGEVLPLPVKDYLKAAAFDFLLCLVASCAIGYATCGAFFVSSGLQGSPIALVAGAGIPLVLLFTAAYNKRSMVIGGIAVALVLAIACFVAAGTSGAAWVFEEVESNPAPFILIMFGSATMTFLCTRKRWMSRVYLIAAALEVCFVEFLYRPGYWPALLVVLASLGAMVVCRNYRANLREVSTDRISFASAFGVGIGYCLVVLGMACALFFLVVVPLNPGFVEFKPFTRYMNYETIEMTGIGDAAATTDENNRTNQTNESLEESSNLDDSSGDSSQGDESNMNPKDNPFIGTLQDFGNSATKSLQEMFNFLIANPHYGFLILFALIVVLSSPYWVKKLLRRRWYRKTCRLPARQRLERLYGFFLRGFRLLGVQPASGMTLAEFAESSKGALLSFGSNESKTTFGDLTRMHNECVYGNREPTDEEMQCFDSFYRGFYRSFVDACGRAKYVFKLKFFRV